jgi:hypothetical protein
LKAVNCMKGVRDKSLRIRRRICSDGRNRKVFVDTLLDLIAFEWNDEKMEAWLTTDAEQVQQSNKEGETDNSTCTASSPKAADSTGTASPPKDEAAKSWDESNAVTLEAFAVESKNLTQASKRRGLTPDEKEAYAVDRAKITEAMSELRKSRDKLKLKVKRKRKIFRGLKKAQKASRQDLGRSDRRLRAEIEEDILHPLGIDSSAYHSGKLAGNAIRRLMEHAEDVAIGLKQKLLECNFKDRKQEVDDFTIGIRLVLLLLDGIYSLLLTKYGKVTPQILKELEDLLELLRLQWVKMQLPMTPKFHCLLRYAVSQLRSTGGGLCDLGEDGIERSHQERLNDYRRFAGLEDFQRRTDSQTKMQHIRLMQEIKETQEKVTKASKRTLKRDRPLAEEHEETKKSGRDEKRARAAQEARNAPITEPQATARQLNMADTCQGKTIQR